MDKAFWAERWEQGQIAFHLGVAHPRLVAHVAHLGAPPARVLVPLCGKTFDMTFLAAQGFDVVGVEFVDDAAQAYFSEAGVVPTRIERGGFVAYQHHNVTIWVGDFFAIPAQILGAVDAIYDRAAVVALPDAMRADYGRHLISLSHPGTRLLLVTFEHDTGSGPPFTVEAAEVQTLFGVAFGVKMLEHADIFAESPRWKERGATRVAEAVWAGQLR